MARAKLLSVLIPSRAEPWLLPTINDVLKNRRGDTEIVCVLDGSWPIEPIPDHPDVHLIFHAEAVGQRAATNEAAAFSRAKYVMKLDAHCGMDEGFDVKLAEPYETRELASTDTTIPRLYNWHLFDWVCAACGNRRYQGPEQVECPQCKAQNTQQRELVWKPRLHKMSDFMRIDADMRFQYWRAFKQRPEAEGDLCEVMGGLGACWFNTRERYWELDGLDEAHGGWGQVGVEWSCKSWLSGGRQMVNKRTWYGHTFRTQGGPGWGFTFHLSNSEVEKARARSRSLWMDNQWSKQVRPFKWLVDHFAPAVEWHQPEGADALAHITAAEEVFYRTHPKPEKARVAKPISGRIGPATLVAAPKSAVLYYSDNTLDPYLLGVCQRQLRRACGHLPIYSVTLKPMDFGDHRIVLPGERSALQLFRQILTGLEAMPDDIEVVYFAEHDVLVPPERFEMTPEGMDCFYYDQNRWQVDVATGRAVFYLTFQTSALFAYRAPLLEHYRKRVERVEREGMFDKKIGHEPGVHKFPRGIDHYPAMRTRCDVPYLDLRHAGNFTSTRWRRDQFRDKRTCEGWTEALRVPGWPAYAPGRFDDLLAALDAADQKVA